MNSKQLSAAISSLASGKGYAVVSAPEPIMARSVKNYPCACLSPLHIVKFSGRRHGRITYAVTLRLMCIAGSSHEAMQDVWGNLECDILGIFTSLTLDNGVISVDKLSLKPSAFDSTNHGEISQKATAEVMVWY